MDKTAHLSIQLVLLIIKVGLRIALLLQLNLTKDAAKIIFEAIVLLPVQGILTSEKVDAMRNYISTC